MAKEKLTLREFIHLKNLEENDIDMSVDGTNCYIAVVFGDIKLTPAGEKQFKRCLDGLHVDGHCIVGDDDDYEAYETWLEEGGDDGGRLHDAEVLLYALAGYCPCSKYDEWFEGSEAKLI